VLGYSYTRKLLQAPLPLKVEACGDVEICKLFIWARWYPTRLAGYGQERLQPAKTRPLLQPAPRLNTNRYIMKWKEPWIRMLRRQGKFDPLTKQELKSGLILTGVLLTFATASAILDHKPIGEVIERALVTVPLSFALSLLISFMRWVSPQLVSSGPNGIVRSKGETHRLIPWSSVRQHRFKESNVELVLELVVSYQPEPETLYLPPHVNTKEISAEIEKMTMHAR
jgi:hypothetical protein